MYTLKTCKAAAGVVFFLLETVVNSGIVSHNVESDTFWGNLSLGVQI